MTLKIPFRFSNAQYADMVYVCTVFVAIMLFVNAVPEYQRCFPNRQMSTRRETGRFPSVRVTAELDVNQYVDEKRNCSDGLSCMGMNERNYLQSDGSNATRTVLPSSDAADCIKKSQRKLVTSNTRSSQPSGEVV